MYPPFRVMTEADRMVGVDLHRPTVGPAPARSPPLGPRRPADPPKHHRASVGAKRWRHIHLQLWNTCSLSLSLDELDEYM